MYGTTIHADAQSLSGAVSGIIETMAQMKPSTQTSPWLTISIGLLGVIVGYVLVVGRSDGMVSANGYSCPMKKEVCTGSNCANHTACTSGACSKDCPGNCNHAA